MDDSSKMPWGLHKDKKMIDVPAHYLLWLLGEGKCSGEVKQYILDNKDVLEQEVKKNGNNNR